MNERRSHPIIESRDDPRSAVEVEIERLWEAFWKLQQQCEGCRAERGPTSDPVVIRKGDVSIRGKSWVVIVLAILALAAWACWLLWG